MPGCLRCAPFLHSGYQPPWTWLPGWGGGGGIDPNALAVFCPTAPATAVEGTANMLTTVNGQNFTATCVVNWAGAAQATTFVSASQLTFTAPTAAAAVGSYSITVKDGAKTALGACSFKITAIPILTVVCPLQPASVLVSTTTTITVKGTLFTAASIVMLGGVDQATTFVNATTLTFPFTSGAVAATDTVSVKDGANTAVTTCPLQTTLTPLLTVTCPTTPATAVAGSTTPLTVTVKGTNFTATTIATADGVDQTTTFVNATTITFPLTIPATVPTTQTIQIGARDGANTAVTTCPFTITTVAVIVPIVTSIFPDYIGSSDPPKTITVTGQNFDATSVVYHEINQRLPTTFVNATTLTAMTAGNVGSHWARIYVENGAAGSAVRSTTFAEFTAVNNPLPQALRESSAPVGAPWLVVLGGNNLGDTAQMLVDGVPVNSTHPRPAELEYMLPASPTPRTYQISARLGHPHGAAHDDVLPVPPKSIPFQYV